MESPGRFDRKSRGEICQFSPLKTPNLSPKFAAKLCKICKALIFNHLKKQRKIARFVKYFYQFLSIQIPFSLSHFGMSEARRQPGR